MKTWPVQIGTVALAVLLAACSSSTTDSSATQASSNPTGTTAFSAPASSAPATPAAAQGGEAPRSDVPWDEVGPGWVLALWSEALPHSAGEEPAPGEPSRDEAPVTLFLVDPAGSRYSIATLPAPQGGRLGLVDWSGDGSRALLAANYVEPTEAISVDLRTGEQTATPVEGYVHYTRPDGQALLENGYFNGDQPGTLKRIALNGSTELSFETATLGGAGQFSGRYLQSPDGRQVVLGTANLGNEVVPRADNSLVVMNSDGTIVRTIPAPMPDARCSPVRWWAPEVVLTHCATNTGSSRQLWQVPLDGSAPTALTAVNNGQQNTPGFEDDLDNGTAWELPSGTFLASAGACGDGFLSRLTADGHTERVNVPGMTESVGVVGAAGDDLVLTGQTNCGGSTSLVSYDPAANTSMVLLGPTVNGGAVSDALLYPTEDS